MPVEDGPKTASRSERRAAFHFEDIVVRGGSKRTVDVPIARVPSGTLESLPVAVVHGSRPGPTICLSGALHGDELNGVAIVRKLLLTLDPKKISGTVLAVPIVNVFGVISGSRYLPDRRDLNRSFPGSARGSLAARLVPPLLREDRLPVPGGDRLSHRFRRAVEPPPDPGRHRGRRDPPAGRGLSSASGPARRSAQGVLARRGGQAGHPDHGVRGGGGPALQFPPRSSWGWRELSGSCGPWG